MRIVVFHYHLLPGGVTEVIVNSVLAVAKHRTDIESVVFVCGRAENAENVAARVRSGGVPVDLVVWDAIDYTSANEPTADARARAVRVQSILVDRFGEPGTLWWVHNFHVGKNPAFTLALCRIAEAADSPLMLLHIHDFPECARFENLAYLHRIAGNSVYPSSPFVRYVVINSRDRDVLVAAGMPADTVHLLVNPLPDNRTIRTGSRDHLIDALSRFASENQQKFDPDKPLLLYPIRAIRRKNVLEMALLAKLAGDWNLITTLPGSSAAERPYSDLVDHAYETGAATGVFGIGRREAEVGTSFEELTSQADLIVSSSVQEGFGMLFVNALAWQVPLFARHLPVLGGIQSVFEGYPASFYGCVRVPFFAPGLSDYRAYLRMRYRERLDEIGSGLGEQARTRVEVQLEASLGGSEIDFAYLPVETQFAILQNAADEGFAATLRDLNQDTVGGLTALPGLDCPDMSLRISSVFGYSAYADGFNRAVQSFGRPEGPATAMDGLQARLISEFADLDNLRLLFAPFGKHG